MPTLIELDGFAHKTAAAAQAGSGFIGTYDSIGRAAGVSFDTTNKRLPTHIASLKIVEDGVTGTNVTRNIAAGNRLLVGSFYFRVATAPSVQSGMLLLSGPTNPCQFRMETTGAVTAFSAAGTNPSTSGTYADSLWHRLDWRIATSTTTFTIDWAVDGVAQTQCVNTGNTAADMTTYRLGSATTTHTLTCWYQDSVMSATTGDHPIEGHVVLPLYPTGEGSDNLLGHIADAASGTTNLYQSADDWNGGTPNTSDYLAQTTIDTAAYAEFTFSGPLEALIWDVIGILGGFASTTGADTADTQVVLADATLVDHIGNMIDYSGSTTVLGYFRRVLTRPSGGWTNANLAGSKVRWGFSNDVIGQPRLSAVMLEYAAPSQDKLTPRPTVRSQAVHRASRW